jgi:hypothetical protein
MSSGQTIVGGCTRATDKTMRTRSLRKNECSKQQNGSCVYRVVDDGDSEAARRRVRRHWRRRRVGRRELNRRHAHFARRRNSEQERK